MKEFETYQEIYNRIHPNNKEWCEKRKKRLKNTYADKYFASKSKKELEKEWGFKLDE